MTRLEYDLLREYRPELRLPDYPHWAERQRLQIKELAPEDFAALRAYALLCYNCALLFDDNAKPANPLHYASHRQPSR